MHVVALKKVVQTGSHRATKGNVSEVPDDVGKSWVAAKFAREATSDEIKAFKAAEEKAK